MERSSHGISKQVYSEKLSYPLPLQRGLGTASMWLVDFAVSKIVTGCGDIQVCLPANGKNLLRYCIEEQGKWFESEIEFVRRWFPQGGKAIDIGANFGIYSLEISKCAGANGKVWAFEPDPRPRAYFYQSKEVNGFENISIADCAVSGVEGEASFSFEEDSVYSHLTHQAGSGSRVFVTTLDQWHGKAGYPRIDFLKLDAEGAEVGILHGGKNFFQKTQPIILLEYRHPEGTNTSAVAALEELGYAMFRYVPGFGVLVPAELDQLKDDAPLNVMAVFGKDVEMLRGKGLLSSVPLFSQGSPEVVSNAGEYELCVDEFHKMMAQLKVDDLVSEFTKSYVYEKLGLPMSCLSSCQRALEAAREGKIGEITPDICRYGVDGVALSDAARFPEWMMATLLHRQEMQARPTSFFHPEKTVALLEASRGFGFLSPLMERRLTLAQGLLK